MALRIRLAGVAGCTRWRACCDRGRWLLPVQRRPKPLQAVELRMVLSDRHLHQCKGKSQGLAISFQSESHTRLSQRSSISPLPRTMTLQGRQSPDTQVLCFSAVLTAGNINHASNIQVCMQLGRTSLNHGCCIASCTLIRRSSSTSSSLLSRSRPLSDTPQRASVGSGSSPRACKVQPSTKFSIVTCQTLTSPAVCRRTACYETECFQDLLDYLSGSPYVTCHMQTLHCIHKHGALRTTPQYKRTFPYQVMQPRVADCVACSVRAPP